MRLHVHRLLLIVGCMLLVGCRAEEAAQPTSDVGQLDIGQQDGGQHDVGQQIVGQQNSAELPQSAPAAQGMDETVLNEIPAYIEQNLSHLHSVLVLRNGELVYEHYVGDRDSDSAERLFSVTKSVTSALIGIAQDKQLIDDLDQPLSDFFSAEQLSDSDPRLASVTLRQLLTMISGTWCSNDSCHNNTLSQVLRRPLRNDPGTVFVYDTSASHLLSGVLTEVTGMSVAAYAQQEIFAPLGIAAPEWDQDVQGLNFGGKGLSLRPRDMAKFGQLFLQQGMWQGERLISAEYVADSTKNHVAAITTEEQYGYLWWIGEIDGYHTYAAVGYGGQFIHVTPALQLVSVITSDYSQPWADNVSIIEQVIVPAVTER